MTPRITQRLVREDEYEMVFALIELLSRPHIEKIWGWHEDWQKDNFSKSWKCCETHLLLAGDEPAGYIQVLREADHLYVKSLGLIPRYQSKGTGKQIMQGLISEAKALNLPIKLSVYTTNPRAEKFYERLGFRKLERDDWFQSMIWESN